MTTDNSVPTLTLHGASPYRRAARDLHWYTDEWGDVSVNVCIKNTMYFTDLNRDSVERLTEWLLAIREAMTAFNQTRITRMND